MSTIHSVIEKVSLAGKLAQFDERWSPKIVAELNDAHVKVVKLEASSSGTTTTTRTSSSSSSPGGCACSSATATSSWRPAS